jgi:DNA-binding response OmpR family regulator
MNEPVSVLVVDDNEDLLETLALILKKRGFKVETAGNGYSALEVFRHGAFDITLMDVILPEMNGVEVFRQIREIDPQARVILMTACSEEGLIAAALREGARCVMHKPLRIDRLIEMITEATSSSPIMLIGDDTEITETMARAAGKRGYRVKPAAREKILPALSQRKSSIP